MAKFLTTRGTASEIEKIINNAQKSLVLISPFIKIPDSLFQNLIAADQRNVRITLIYGKNNLEPQTREQFQKLKNFRLCFLENLHAKCYFNEQDMVISSLNLYDFSEQNNREMSVLISRSTDEEVFNDAYKEARIMLSLAKIHNPRQKAQELPSNHFSNKQNAPREEKTSISSILFKDITHVFSRTFDTEKGHCIACNRQIEYNEDRPFCPDCYKNTWKRNGNSKHYCHACGKESPTTLNKPLCRSCWEETL